MDTNKLIQDALKASKPAQVKRKELFEYDEDTIEIKVVATPKTKDAITRLATRQKKITNFKRKAVRDWNNADFTRYLESTLKSTHGITLETTGAKAQDSVWRIYDKIVTYIGDKMCNATLKDYLDWWISIYAVQLQKPCVSVDYLNHDYIIERFLKANSYVLKKPAVDIPTIDPKMNDTDIYKTGGISMLLMSRGIVITCREMKRLNESSIFTKVSTALRNFSKDIVQRVLDITLANSKYNNTDKVDFITLSKSAIDLYGLEDYRNIKYTDYFEGETR